VRIIPNEGFLKFSINGERVNIIHLKFHVILFILEFLVEIAIQDGEEKKSNLFRESLEWVHMSFPVSLWICSFHDMATISLLSKSFIHALLE